MMEKNVLGTALKSCCQFPMTGFFRDGRCRTCPEDLGKHIACVVMTEDFLVFSKKAGNDLSTPIPQYDFPGLIPGDKWCLCALRWVEAYEAGVAPLLILEATEESMLDFVPLDELKKFEYDTSSDELHL